MEPIRWENETAVYTTEQFEFLDDIPYHDYIVVEGSPTYNTSIQYIAQSEIKKIHRYDRQSRFKKTLYNLLGWSNFSQTVSLASMTHILAPLKAYIKDDSTTSYEDARKILLHFGEKKLVDSIPALLKMVNKPPPLIVDQKNLSETIQLIMEDFSMIERRFFREGYKGDRVYFPNMKYLALKLLVERGAVNVCIPLLKTRRKLKDIELVYQKLLHK